MNYKILERTNFNWFGINELKDLHELEENQIKETLKYSFAPFVPYWVYSFMRSNWDFILLRVIAAFLFYMAYVVYYFVFIFGFLFKDMKSILPTSFTSITGSSLKYASVSSLDPTTFLGKFLIAMIIALIVYLVIDFSILIAEGIYARRLSWNRLSWKDFESYRYSEQQWNVAGMVFCILRIIGMIACIALLILGSHFFGSLMNI